MWGMDTDTVIVRIGQNQNNWDASGPVKVLEVLAKWAKQ